MYEAKDSTVKHNNLQMKLIKLYLSMCVAWLAGNTLISATYRRDTNMQW